MRLQDKGVPCSDCCPHCETNYENDWHMFMRCDAENKYGMRLGYGREFMTALMLPHAFSPFYAGCRIRFATTPQLCCSAYGGEGTTWSWKGMCRVFELLSSLLEIHCNNENP